MDKIFRDYIWNELVRHFASSAAEFHPFKLRVQGYGGDSRILRWIPREPLHCFIHFLFLQNQSQVIPYVQWSRFARFPSKISYPDDMHGYLKLHGDDLGSLEQLPEVWLSAWDFEKSREFFWVDSTPSVDRMALVYDRADVQELLRHSGVKDWRKTTWLHSWSVLSTFGENLTEKDIESAVSGVLQRLIGVCEQEFLPYLRCTVPRLLE